MTNKELLINLLSSTMGIKEVNWIKENAQTNPHVFEFLFDQLSNGNKSIAWHSMWVLEKLSQSNTSYFTGKHVKSLIDTSIKNTHYGTQRLLYTILLRVKLHEEEIPTAFINKCFEQISSPKCPIAVQCTAAKMMEKIGKKSPEFLNELSYTLENIDSNYCSKGFLSTKTKILKRLETNTNTRNKEGHN